MNRPETGGVVGRKPILTRNPPYQMPTYSGEGAGGSSQGKTASSPTIGHVDKGSRKGNETTDFGTTSNNSSTPIIPPQSREPPSNRASTWEASTIPKSASKTDNLNQGELEGCFDDAFICKEVQGI